MAVFFMGQAPQARRRNDERCRRCQAIRSLQGARGRSHARSPSPRQETQALTRAIVHLLEGEPRTLLGIEDDALKT